VSAPEQIPDAECVEDTQAIEEQTAAMLPAVRERRSEVLRPLDPAAVLESFATYQRLLRSLLTPDDWQGPPNKPGSFVKKKGWRKIATAFDLDVKLVPGTLNAERDAEGNPLRAEAVARAITPAGRTMDGDGYCSSDEPRFKDAKGRQKLENDLRATATTRAKNRAIADLVGMGDVSAEEVDDTPQHVKSGPKYGPATSDAQLATSRQALGYLMGCEPDGNPVGAALDEIERRAGGYLPQLVLGSLAMVGSKVKNRREALAQETRDDLADSTDAAIEAAAEEFTRDPDTDRAEAILAAESGAQA
jgi:hypothetical protein